MSRVSLLPIVSLYRCLLLFVSIELRIKCRRSCFSATPSSRNFVFIGVGEMGNFWAKAKEHSAHYRDKYLIYSYVRLAKIPILSLMQLYSLD